MAISTELRKTGKPIKRETLGKHLRGCLNGVVPEVNEATAQSVADAPSQAATDADLDFARLVQQQAIKLMQRGDLRVTATHGLQAQALLDRRAEKQADRDLALNLARLMSGALTPAPVQIIEGRVIEPLGLGDGLAPDVVVEARQ